MCKAFSAVLGAGLFLLSGTACAQLAPHSVTLSWTASISSGVTGYRIYRGTASGGPYTILNSVVGTSYMDASVQAGATYYYVVTAVDGSGIESAYSNEAQAVVPSQPVSATIGVTPGSLSFNQTAGGPGPSSQSVSISSSGAALNFSAGASTNNGGSWLSVSPGAGSAPRVLIVSVNVAGLAPGTYTGSVTIVSAAANSTQTISVTLAVSSAAAVPTVAAVMNAATFLPSSVAPGQIVTIFGAGIGPVTPASLRVNPGGFVDQSLAGVRVLFDGVAAPMIYASATMVSAIVPYTISGRFSTRLQVEFQGTASPGLDIAVAAAAPGIFTMNQSGSGQGAILNQDYSVNSAGNRAPKGSVVMIFGTGEGQTNPAGVDGLITGSVPRNPLQPVSVTIGGQPAEVLYAGSAPGLVAGMLQVNARVTDGILSGDAVPVVLSIGSASSPSTVTMAVQE